MVKVTQVAVCSQINTKHINTVWAESTILECSTYWCIEEPVGFKRFKYIFEKEDVQMWILFFWLKIKANGGVLCKWQ